MARCQETSDDLRSKGAGAGEPSGGTRPVSLQLGSSHTLSRISSSLEKFGYARAAMLSVVVLMLIVVVVRFYHASVTGFILPDEAWYYNTFVRHCVENRGQWMCGVPMQFGQYRAVFAGTLLLFFSDVTDISTFLLRGAVYSAMWATGSVVLVYKIVRQLKVPDKPASLLILSLPLFPIFIILGCTVGTETLGLFLALVGIYFAARFVESGSPLNALLCSVGFIAAYEVREPYLLLAVGCLILVSVSRKRSVKATLAYALPLALVLPVPVNLQPLQLAQPVYAYLFAHLSQWASPTVTINPTTPTTSPPPPTNAGFLLGSSVTVPLRGNPTEIARSFLVGLLYGYNPLFAAFTFVSLGIMAYLVGKRSRTAAFTLWIVTLALLSYLIPLIVIVGTLSNNPRPLSLWSSTIIRSAHTSLPALLGFRFLYERVKPRHILVLILALLVLAPTQISQFTYTIESSLSGPLGEPIDRLSFNYRAPYYKLYLLARDSGKTLVLGTELRGIVLYMSMLPNVEVDAVPANRSDFRALLNRGWDTIFLYDNWYTIKDPDRAVREQWYPPYYLDILISRSYAGYSLETLWVDGESYALRMVKASACGCDSSTASCVPAYPISPLRTDLASRSSYVQYESGILDQGSDDISVKGVASRSTSP